MFNQVLELTLFPEFAKFAQQATLGSRDYRLEFEWRPRLEAWYVNIFDPSTDEPVVTGRRITSYSSLTRGRIEFERGAGLLAIGPDPYDRYDLGTRLKVFFIQGA